MGTLQLSSVLGCSAAKCTQILSARSATESTFHRVPSRAVANRRALCRRLPRWLMASTSSMSAMLTHCHFALVGFHVTNIEGDKVTDARTLERIENILELNFDISPGVPSADA